MEPRAAVATCGAAQQGLVSRAALRTAGTPSGTFARAVAAGQVVRVRAGVYALAPLAAWPAFAVGEHGVDPVYVQQVRAVLLSLGGTATAAGVTAACLRGWGLLHEPVRTVCVAVAHGRSRARLANVRTVQRRRVHREALGVVSGTAPLWVTSAVSTVLECCRELPLLDAVVVCDSALRSGQVTLRELQQAAARLHGHRRAARVRRALELCDPASGSVLESVLRVRMVQDGIEGFATQQAVRDAAGRHVLRVDFCFATARLVVEADGARWHQDAARDQGLDNRLAAAGWRVLRFTWSQVVHDPAAVLALLRAALAAGHEDVQSDLAAAA